MITLKYLSDLPYTKMVLYLGKQKMFQHGSKNMLNNYVIRLLILNTPK